MIGRDSLLWRYVAKHSFLLVIVSAHSLVSLTFLTSDEFFQLKLQRNCIFQQAVKAGMTFAVDGGITVPGKFGARVGDSIVVTENGFEYLTNYPRELAIV
jgi:hypothetical protein